MFKCFFSYYGSKSKIANLYPKPKYGKIVEPFAGAANYSVINFENEVYLTDLNEDINDVWNFLINASEKDILSLPKFKLGLDLRNLNLSNGERKFCGFWANMGSNGPRNIVSKFAGENVQYFETKKTEVAKNLHRIRHWKINRISYENLFDDFLATWFVDPPYIKGGELYKYNTIDYPKLAEWCKIRKGLTIVCENDTADWLNFESLVEISGQCKNTTEVVYIQDL